MEVGAEVVEVEVLVVEVLVVEVELVEVVVEMEVVQLEVEVVVLEVEVLEVEVVVVKVQVVVVLHRQGTLWAGHLCWPTDATSSSALVCYSLEGTQTRQTSRQKNRPTYLMLTRRDLES